MATNSVKWLGSAFLQMIADSLLVYSNKGSNCPRSSESLIERQLSDLMSLPETDLSIPSTSRFPFQISLVSEFLSVGLDETVECVLVDGGPVHAGVFFYPSFQSLQVDIWIPLELDLELLFEPGSLLRSHCHSPP